VVVVMYVGRLVEMADTEDLLPPPLHPYTEALLASGPSSPWQDVVADPSLSLPSTPLFD
jgi:peptide/nickel transport system ATP-binding protein